MRTGFNSNEEYWSITYLFYKICCEKSYFIPTWVYYGMFCLGLWFTVYSKLGILLLWISLYQIAKRDGRREGWLEGFEERGSLHKSELEDGTTLKEEMSETIQYFSNKDKKPAQPDKGEVFFSLCSSVF